MEDYFSPEEIRTLISRCDSDRQRIVLFLLYNYGLSVAEAAELKAGQFMLKPDYILFNFNRKITGKSHTYKIQSENSRLFYRVLSKLQHHEPLLHKDKNLPVSESIIKKDLFDLAITMNRKIIDSQLFESHLFWLFRKGVSFAQAVEEYGLALSGKPFKIWESAMLSGRLWPVLLD